jgi:hypothetical protein
MQKTLVALFATAGIVGAATLIASQGLSGLEGVSVAHIDSSVRRGTRPIYVTPEAESVIFRATDWTRRGSRVGHKPTVVTRKWNTGATAVRRGTRVG